MLDANITREAVRLLGSVIGAILEDTAPTALRPGLTSVEDYTSLLLATGQDVSTLAAAIGVLTRRTGVA